MVVLAICFFMTVGNELKKDATQNKQICKHQPSWISKSANQKWFRLPGFFPAGGFPCGVFFLVERLGFFPSEKLAMFAAFFVSLLLSIPFFILLYLFNFFCFLPC